jgi:hypothetical protein
MTLDLPAFLAAVLVFAAAWVRLHKSDGRR